MSVPLRTKWLWLRALLQSLKLLILPVSSKEFLDIQATVECGFTLKRVPWHDKKMQSHIFLCICYGRFWIHLPIVVYHPVCVDQKTHLTFVFQNPHSFCWFVVSMCDIFHFQIFVKLFFVWQWRFIESLLTIHVHIILGITIHDNILFPSDEIHDNYVEINGNLQWKVNIYNALAAKVHAWFILMTVILDSSYLFYRFIFP